MRCSASEAEQSGNMYVGKHGSLLYQFLARFIGSIAVSTKPTRKAIPRYSAENRNHIFRYQMVPACLLSGNNSNKLP